MAEAKTTSALQGYIAKNRLTLLITGVIAVTFVLVSVAMTIYNSSGAAQLDLSGPGFKDVQKGVQEEKDVTAYPGSGAFDKAAFDEFTKLYDERVNAIKATNGFDPAAVNNDSFNLVTTTPNS